MHLESDNKEHLRRDGIPQREISPKSALRTCKTLADSLESLNLLIRFILAGTNKSVSLQDVMRMRTYMHANVDLRDDEIGESDLLKQVFRF